jgi:hypothetical protein
VLGLPAVSRPAWRACLVTATYSSGSQAVVKLASLACPAPNSAVPILAVVILANESCDSLYERFSYHDQGNGPDNKIKPAC